MPASAAKKTECPDHGSFPHGFITGLLSLRDDQCPSHGADGYEGFYVGRKSVAFSPKQKWFTLGFMKLSKLNGCQWIVGGVVIMRIA